MKIINIKLFIGINHFNPTIKSGVESYREVTHSYIQIFDSTDSDHINLLRE